MLDFEVVWRILYNGYFFYILVNGSFLWIFFFGYKNFIVLCGLKLEFYCSEGCFKIWCIVYCIDVL